MRARSRFAMVGGLAVGVVCWAVALSARAGQTPDAPASPPSAGSAAPAAPSPVERGKIVFADNCVSCHGDDARGGGDPNTDLSESPVVLRDKDGEAIGKIVTTGLPDVQMPPFALTDAEIKDLAAFLRSIVVRPAEAAGTPAP